MSNINEQHYIIQGLAVGNEANKKIADVIVSRSVKMLDQALQENFETILQAKLSVAIQETLNRHAEQSQTYAKKFLGKSKTQLAQNLVDSQHSNQLASLQSHLNLDELEAFDTDLLPEVNRIADEAGAITIKANPDSIIGF
jgi:hypothetical protein